MDIKYIIYGILIIALLYYIFSDDIIEHAENNTNNAGNTKNNLRQKCIKMFSTIVKKVRKLKEYDYLCKDDDDKTIICDKDKMEKKICTKKGDNELFEEGKTYYMYPWEQEIKFEKVSVDEMLKYDKYKTNFYGLKENTNPGYLTNLYKIKNKDNKILKIINNGSGLYYAEFSNDKIKNIPDYAVWRIIPIIDDKYIIIDEHQWLVILNEHPASSKNTKILDSGRWFSLTDKDLYKDSRQVFTIKDTKRSEIEVLREKTRKQELQKLYDKQPERLFCNDSYCYSKCTSDTSCNWSFSSTKKCNDTNAHGDALGYIQEFTDSDNKDMTGSDLDTYGCGCSDNKTLRICKKKAISDQYWQNKFKDLI